MANKTKTTEDHMIEQTFENFDNEITGSQTESQMTGMTQEPTSNDKKKNTYNLLFIAGGATCLALGGYFFLVKDSAPPKKVVAKVDNSQGQATAPVVPSSAASAPEVTGSGSVAEKFLAGEKVKVDTPVAVSPVDPLAQLQQGAANNPINPITTASSPVTQTPPVAVVSQVDPLTQLQQNAASNSVVNTPVDSSVVVDPMKQLQQNTGKEPLRINIVAGKPVVIDGVSINVPTNNQVVPVTPNANTNGSVSVLNNMGAAPTQEPKNVSNVDAVIAQATGSQTEVNVLTQQTDENKKFVDILESINSKFGTVEKIWEEQKVVNTKVDERLTALEKAVLGKNPNVAKSNVAKSNVVRKTNVARTNNVRRNSSDGNVLIDKSNGRRSNVAQSQSSNEIDSQKVQIHSIYGGRVWTKNEDGSLSTFTVGDKLPNGEVIRRIDDENFTISTNKKTIKY